MSDFAIDAKQLVKKFPARPGTGDKTSDTSPAPRRRRFPFGKREPKATFTAVNGVDLQIDAVESADHCPAAQPAPSSSPAPVF